MTLDSTRVLVIEICDVCRARQWYHEGDAIDPDQASDLACAVDAMAS